MRTALDHPLVRDYLRRLHDEAVRLRADEGRELEAQIREHLSEALPAEPTEVEVREVLDRLGEPAHLVDEAGGGPLPDPGPAPADDGAWREVAALVGLVGAALLFWFPVVNVVLWLGGLLLLVLSRRWSVADKLWGALVLGLGPVVLVAAGAVAFLTTGEVCHSDASGVETCTPVGGGGTAALELVAVVVPVLFLALYLWTLVRLARRAARRDGAGRPRRG